MGSEPAESAPAPVRPAPSPATEERRFVGLTKEVLSAHTQKEEQEYVDRFRHRILQSPYSSYLQLDNSSMAHSHHPGTGLVIETTSSRCSDVENAKSLIEFFFPQVIISNH